MKLGYEDQKMGDILGLDEQANDISAAYPKGLLPRTAFFHVGRV